MNAVSKDITPLDVPGDRFGLNARFTVLADGRLRIDCDADTWTLPADEARHIARAILAAEGARRRQADTDYWIALLEANGVDHTTVLADPPPEDHGDCTIVYHLPPQGAGWESFPKRYPIRVRP